MAYELEALLVRIDGDALNDLLEPHVVLDDHLGLALIPITRDVRAARSTSEEKTEPGFYSLTEGIVHWAQGLSRRGQVFYVHTQFFGGVGSQAAVGWKYGERVLDPVFTTNHKSEADDWYKVVGPEDSLAISTVLRLLGVESVGNDDEFATVGLGRYRSTDRWVEAAQGE